MKRFLKYFVIATIISMLITLIYWFIDYELAGWFTYKIQFMMIPGFVCTISGFWFFQNGSMNTNSVIHVNSTSFSDHQQSVINNKDDYSSKIPLIIALLSSGIIQIVIGFLLYKY
ncbi:MAG: hypothetical protein OCD02_18700 [Spirochaetaceae bacterium]